MRVCPRAWFAAVTACVIVLAGCSGPSRGGKEWRSRARLETLWAQASPSPVGRYDAAKAQHQKGQYAESAFLFQRWLATYAKNPLEPAALYYLANAQLQTGNRSGALATSRRLAKDYPRTDWAVFARQDMVALKAGPPEGHIRDHWWHPWDWFRPYPPEVLEFEEARKHFRGREFEKALAGFRTVAERNPDNPIAPAAWYHAGRCYEYLSQLDKARETFQHVLATYPGTEWEWLAQDDLRRLRAD